MQREWPGPVREDCSRVSKNWMPGHWGWHSTRKSCTRRLVKGFRFLHYGEQGPGCLHADHTTIPLSRMRGTRATEDSSVKICSLSATYAKFVTEAHPYSNVRLCEAKRYGIHDTPSLHCLLVPRAAVPSLLQLEKGSACGTRATVSLTLFTQRRASITVTRLCPKVREVGWMDDP